MILLTLMAIVVIGIIRFKNLFNVIILGSIYSFLMASILLVLDAVDVDLTEASVGAGISTVLMLSALYLTKRNENPITHNQIWPLLIALITGALLVFGTYGMPEFGIINTPMHNHVGGEYLARSISDTGIENVVTSVLASYRGFDTLGEVTVIFTAAIGIIAILKKTKTKVK